MEQNYSCMNAQWFSHLTAKNFQTKFGEYLKRKFLKIDRAS